MRYFFPVGILGLILFFLWRSLSHEALTIPSPLVNKPMPHFVAETLLSSKKTLTEKIFLGHLSLLVVWSSWCSSCFLEQAFLFYLKKNTRLHIIGLNYRDDLLNAKRWLKQYGNPYHPIIFDPKGLLGINLGVYGVPESFLIDSKGIIRYKYIGPLNESGWNLEIKPLLNRYANDL